MLNMKMPCGERMVRALTGGDIDRVPFGVGLGWHPWGETSVRWQCENGNENLEVAKEFGYDGSFAIPDVEFGMLPKFEPVVLEETAEFIVRRDENGIVRRELRNNSGMPEFLSNPVGTREDWERLKEERFRIGDRRRLRQNWDDFRAGIKVSGEAVQVGDFPWGVFGTPRDLMGTEEYLISFCADPELLKDIMNHLTDLWIWLYEEVAKEVQIDHIHIWEDMAGRHGSLISPGMVKEFMIPCYDRIRQFAEAHDVRMISVDTDGDCSELVPIMREHGVNVFFPFEVQAGSDVRAYRKKYPDLGIWGGLDKRTLALTRKEIDAELEKAEWMIGSGHYVPMYDHLIPPDVPWENFCYAVKRLKDICNK